MKQQQILPFILILLLAFSGCGAAGKAPEEPSASAALTQRWTSGNISDFMGLYEEEIEPDEGGLFSLLQKRTTASLPEIPEDAVFPLELPLTVTTPDLAAIMTELHFENYEDSESLLADVQAELEKDGYPERTVTVDVTIEQDGDELRAQQNREAYFAFYGGFAELYMQEYEKYLEDVGNKLGEENS